MFVPVYTITNVFLTFCTKNLSIIYQFYNNNLFGKVREDVKVNSATHIAMGCCNETNHVDNS